MKKNKVIISFHVDQETIDQLENVINSSAQYESRAQFMRIAVKEKLQGEVN